MKTERGGFRMLRREQLMQELVHDSYKAQRKPTGPVRCRGCAAVYRKGRWTWGAAGGGVRATLCPACRRIKDRLPAGFVRLGGEFFAAHKDEILRRVRHCEESEKSDHPLERIMTIEGNGRSVVVTTTDAHLARRIADALHDAYKGELEYRYSKAENLLRVAWRR